MSVATERKPPATWPEFWLQAARWTGRAGARSCPSAASPALSPSRPPALQHLVRTGIVSTFLQSPTTTDPRLTWIARNCLHVKAARAATSVPAFAVYFCLQ
jgi:hypothetical protein